MVTENHPNPEIPPPGPKLKLGWLPLILFACAAAWHLSSWPTRLRYPGEQTGIEGICLAEMVHFRSGVPVYAPGSLQRFDAVIYGPLYYLLGMTIIDPNKPAYLPLRLVSILSTLGCAAGCALLAFWLSRAYLAAVLAALIFFSYELVSLYGLSARCDMGGVFLAFSGFLVAFRFRHSRSLLWATPLLLAGLFYKQQFVAAPAAIFIFLVLEKRYRLAAQFAGLMTLCGLILLAFFQYVVYAGQDFFLRLVTYNTVFYNWGRFGNAAVVFALMFSVPLLVGLEYLRRHPNRLLACYLGCLIPFTLFIVGKEGSDTNYFVEVILVVSCLFAALMAESCSLRSRVLELSLLGVVTVFLAMIVRAPIPGADDFRRDQALQDYLRANFPPGTKSLGYYSGDLLRAGLETPISDFFQYSWLVCNGKIPAQDLIGQLEHRHFGVILVGFDLNDEHETHRPNGICMTESLHRTILKNYQLAATLEMPEPEKIHAEDRFYVWVPRKSLAATSPNGTVEEPAQGRRAEPFWKRWHSQGSPTVSGL
jgi:hypothetical protein